jgi:uncharacterized membrane protein
MKTDANIDKGKNTAIISYITFVGGLIALFMNAEEKNQFASFHIRQAIGLHLLQISVFIIISGFNNLIFIFPFWILFFVLWFYAFLGAVQGRRVLIPLVGNYFQNWFKTIAP